MKFDETSEEEPSEPLHRVIGGGVSVGDDQVSMATVTVDEREEDGDLFILEVRVHEPSYKCTVGVQRQLP